MTPRLLWWMAAIYLLLAVGGCAVSKSRFSETHYAPLPGHLESKLTMTTYSLTTVGSKMEAGAGKLTLRQPGGVHDKFVAVNQSASGLQAGGDPVALAHEIMPALGPLMKAAAAGTASATLEPMLAGILKLVMGW